VKYYDAAGSLTTSAALISGDPQLTNVSTYDFSLGVSSSALDLSTLPSPMPSTFSTNFASGYSTTVNQQPRNTTNGMVARTATGSALDVGSLERGLG